MDNLFVPFHPQRGRPRKYTPSQLLSLFEQYINDRLSRPIVEKETDISRYDEHRGEKESRVVHPHPISIGDFCIYLGTYRAWWNQLPEDYSIVKDHIATYIEQFQLKGASIGLFNANIVSRLLGLADKKYITSGGEPIDRIFVETPEQKEKLENIKDLED